jgi:hypothetical protein
MTIAAAYLTSEGVVFGADSTTTIITSGGVAQLLNYAQKIFEVGECSRLGICTWGAGRVGMVSHRTLIARLADELDLKKAKVNDAVHAFMRIVSQEYGDGKNTGKVGYLLGGWDPETHLPECYHFVFEPSVQPTIVPVAMGEARFFGCPEFFTRVFRGYDSKLPGNILRELKQLKVYTDKGTIDETFDRAFKNATAPLAATGFGDLPIREAIDYIHTYLHITIKVFKFRFGPPICGGPIEIAFVSSDRNFRWVCHKSFERAIYEQEVRDE